MPIAAFEPDKKWSETDIRHELAVSRVEFHLSRKFWEAFSPGFSLSWSRPLRFKKDNADKIPTQKGIYAFSIRCGNSSLPAHRLVFYIGQAGGGKSSKNTLRKRFDKYFYEKRPRVLRFFNDYAGHVDYQYCELDIDGSDLLELEEQLNNAMQPPANQRDFSTKFRSARGANLQ